MSADPAAQRSLTCYLVEKDSSGQVRAAVAHRPASDLPPGEVLVRVEWSSLNYKDALSATGHPGVTRKFPHVPGIDLAGTVLESAAETVRAGDAVLVTGFDQGMNTWGGFASLARVPAEWVVPLPPGLTAREAMVLGTAGLTAALAVDALRAHDVRPERGEVAVTGASGGVGSLAVALLARLGYTVVAVSGKPAAAELLSALGAARVVGREEVSDASGKPLLPGRWAGAVDTVGGATLATLVRALKPRGCVAACGLVGGVDLPLTVYPFILRGATLAGIDSVECPLDTRRRLWSQLAGPWRLALPAGLVQETPLGGLEPWIAKILRGEVTGRVLVRPEAFERSL